MHNNQLNTVGFLVMRAQPLHIGHIQLIEQALQRCARLVIVLGSVNRPRSWRNPWTFEERRDNLLKRFHGEHMDSRLGIVPINDYRYSDAQWLSDFNALVKIETQRYYERVVIFGHRKPGNDYLDMFTAAGYEYQDLSSTYDKDATTIRKALYAEGLLPEPVMADMAYFAAEKERFSVYPYPDTLNFNCADAIVECNGHVALIQRGAAPGKGNWALPGGFKNSRETFLEAALRELDEEVNLRVPRKVLLGSVVNTRLFDDPYRGYGIPRNTLAVHFRVEPDRNGKLPEIRPADDAMHCFWMPINSVMNDISMHDDHQDIIGVMLNVTPTPAHLNSRFL